MQNVILKNKPVILKNNDFKTIQVRVVFPFENSYDNLANMQLLPNLLGYKNNTYPTENEFILARKKLLILYNYVFFSTFGDTACYFFNLSIPKEDILDTNNIEEQFKFFRDYIYNPYTENGVFSEFDLEKEKKNLILGMDNALKNIKPYQSIRLKELIDEDGFLTNDIIYHRELIDKVTTKSLYEHYQNVIYNGQPIIYIMGDVDEEKMNQLCDKYLYLNKFNNKNIDVDLYHYLKPRKKVQEITEKSTFKDSAISFVYKVKDFKEDEYVILNLLRDLLTSLSSRLLDIKLRDENELIYSSRVISDPYFGLFEITAFIHKDNLEIVKEKINELIRDFKNIELITPLLENIKDRKRINLLRKLDSKFQILDDFMFDDLGLDDSSEKYYEKVLKVSADDISNFVDKLVIDTIYFLEEEEHE